MPRKSTDLIAQATRIIESWKRHFSTKRFSGLTIAEFEEMIRPARELRTELAELAISMRILLARRRSLDRELRPGVQRLVHAVRGDPDAGENSAMYATMGYVTKRKRRKPGRKKKAKSRATRAP